MKKILITICLIGGLAMLWSCSDDKDSYPVPSDIENLKATPAPGQITLSWTNQMCIRDRCGSRCQYR